MNSLKTRIRSLVKRAVRSAGFEVARLSPALSAGYQIALALRKFDIDLVLDVGANQGQFASELRSFGFGGTIVSFEPLSAAHAELSNRAARDPKWHVHPPTAIGDIDGSIDINVAGNLYSSSILPMRELHMSAAENSRYVSVERVPIARLDRVAIPYLETATRPFLKIDTQGFEKHVLDGADAILPRMGGVLSEVSLAPLYEGQPLWLEMLARLEAEGFALWSIQPGFTDPRDGRTLQLDAMWFRMPAAAEPVSLTKP